MNVAARSSSPFNEATAQEEDVGFRRRCAVCAASNHRGDRAKRRVRPRIFNPIDGASNRRGVPNVIGTQGVCSMRNN